MFIRISSLVLILLLASILASIGNAKSIENNNKIQAINTVDGVVFETSEKGVSLAVNLVGPAGYQFRKTFSDAEVAYIDINSVAGVALADGFYKYEIKAYPAITISREESSKMPDRNALKWKSQPKTSPVNGSFRIINGQRVDERLEEFGFAGDDQK